MFEHYLATLLSLRQVRDLASSTLADAPVRPEREDRNTEWDRRGREPASPVGTAEAAAPANPPVAAVPYR